MKTYTVKGYTSGQHPDFMDTVQLFDNTDFSNWMGLKAFLLKTNIPTDYLDVYDFCNYEQRDDLANFEGQVVLLAESYGCDNCAEISSEWQEGCDGDMPHGAFMLTFDVI